MSGARTAADECVAVASRSTQDARSVVSLGGRSSDMVVVLEIAFLIVCAVLGMWLFSRTSRWAHLKAGGERGQDDLGREKHELNRTQHELGRKHFRNDDAGPQYGGGQNYSGGGGI
jgi:hypothetical protein